MLVAIRVVAADQGRQGAPAMWVSVSWRGVVVARRRWGWNQNQCCATPGGGRVLGGRSQLLCSQPQVSYRSVLSCHGPHAPLSTPCIFRGAG